MRPEIDVNDLNRDWITSDVSESVSDGKRDVRNSARVWLRVQQISTNDATQILNDSPPFFACVCRELIRPKLRIQIASQLHQAQN